MKWEKDLIRDIRIEQPIYQETDDVSNRCKEMFNIESIGPNIEFSICNQNCLRESFLNIQNWCKCIVEIGVHRNGDDSSTNVFIHNKNPDTTYLGVDLQNKSFLHQPHNNQYTLSADSSDYNQVVSYLNSIGQTSIDYLFIDGYHSIDQVLKDWEFTKLLSDNGIVGFHDTTFHLGPRLFLEALNRDKWDVETYCIKYDDWGIGFVKRKNNE